jgi:hypothetical protein
MEQPGVASLALVAGAAPVRVESALFEQMLVGWRRQQLSRRLGGSLIDRREQTVRRFQEFAQGWPWSWRAEELGRLARHQPVAVPRAPTRTAPHPITPGRTPPTTRRPSPPRATRHAAPTRR